MNNNVGKGALVLIVSGFVCKFFGALFRLPLTNIIGIEGIGIFQMIMSVYSLMLIFVSSGVTNSLSKLVSSARASGQNVKIGAFFRQAFIFTISLALTIGLFFAIFSKQIASIQGIGQGYTSYLLLILLLPLGALIGVFRGIIQGYENMTPTAVSQIIEQIIKFAFGLFFAYVLARFGSTQGVFGAFLGITLSEVLALLYLFIAMKKVKLKASKYNVKKEFYSAVLPLSFGSAITPLASAIEAIIISSLLSLAGLSRETGTLLYGLQSGVVGALLHFPLIISLSIGVALLPKISFLSAKEDVVSQKELIGNSFHIMWYFLIPLIFGIVSISKELYAIIYPNLINGYVDTAYQLTILGGIAVVLSAIMQFLVSLLQAKGFFTYSMIFNIIGAVAKILMLCILAPKSSIGIFAIPISNIFLYSIVCICALIKLGSLVKVQFFEFILPILSAVVMYISVRLILSAVSGILGLLLAVFAGAIIYIVIALPLTINIMKRFLSRLKINKIN